MINLKRLMLVTASVTAIFIQGCGCSSSNKKTPTPEATFELTGQASKGILIGANVSAYGIANGQLNIDSVIASTTTGNDGGYTLDIPESSKGAPIVVRVTPATSGTVMRCDLAAGCGGQVEFGEDLSVAADSDLRLDAVVASVQPATSANITVLTNLAAGAAIKTFASSATAAEVASAIARANSQVANRFGIVGDLTRMPVIDLTNPTAVAGAIAAGNSSSVQYASLNAAIVQAVIADGATSIENALATFSTAFNTSGGIAGNTSTAAATGLDEILAAARSVLAAVEQSSGGSVDLSALDADLAAEQAFAANEEPDQFDPGTPSDTTGKSGLEIVKAMVGDVRDLSLTIGDNALGDGATIGSVSAAFDLQLEAADLATGADLTAAVQALGMAVNAIEETRSAHAFDQALTSLTALNGVEVIITETVDAVEFGVAQTITVVQDELAYPVEVNLTAASMDDYVDASEENTTSLSGSITYAIAGSATTDVLGMTIKEGSAATVGSLSAVITDDPTTGGTDQSHSLGELSFALNLGLAQTGSETVTDPISVDGALSVKVTNVAVALLETADTGDFKVTAGLVNLQFSGSVQNASGEKYRFAFAANGDASGVTYSEVWNSTSEVVTGESEDSFGQLSASLQFTADLAGQLDLVKIKVGAVRTGLDDGTFILSLVYPGKKLVVERKIVDGVAVGTFTAKNQDGVVLSVTRTEVAEQIVISGSISLNGVEYATLATGDNGLLTITYTDDTFESL